MEQMKISIIYILSDPNILMPVLNFQGNGHPIAAVVTTKAVADSFLNTGIEYFNKTEEMRMRERTDLIIRVIAVAVRDRPAGQTAD